MHLWVSMQDPGRLRCSMCPLSSRHYGTPARVPLSAAGAFCCALALQPGNEPSAGAPGQQTSTFCVREPSHRRLIGFGYTDSLADRPLFTFDLDSWIPTTEDVDKCTFFSSWVARKPLSCNYYIVYVGRLIAPGWGTTSAKLILAHDWGERIKGRTIRQWPGDSLGRAPCVAT